MNYKGSYSGETSYSVGDVVVYTDGIAYQLFQAAAAGTTPHEKRVWRIVNQPLQEVVLMFHNMLTTMNEEISTATESGMIAPAYSKKTYAAGDIVTHSGKLYKAKNAISPADSSWTAAHWDEITVGGQLSALAAAIPDNISDDAITLAAGDDEYLITVDTTGETPELAVTLIEEEAET